MWHYIVAALFLIAGFAICKHRAALKAKAEAEKEKITARLMAEASKVRAEVKAKL